MRLLDRYVLIEFLKLLLLSLCAFVVIFAIVDLFEKIQDFMDGHATAWVVGRYYLCLQFGESFADRLLLPPWLAMWLANLVLGGWGLLETLRVCDVRLRGRARRPAPPVAAEPVATGAAG